MGIAIPSVWPLGAWPTGPWPQGPWPFGSGPALLLVLAAALGLQWLQRQLPADSLLQSLARRSRLSLLVTLGGLWLTAQGGASLRQGLLTVGLVWTLLRCKGTLLRHAQAHPQWLPGRSEREQAFLLDVGNKAITLLAVLIAGVSVLRLAGVSPAVLLTASGVGAAAVGFGAKAVVENLLSGVMLYVHRPFAVGDAIELPDRRLSGRVQRIGSFYTELRSEEGQPLYLPNALFAGIAVGNLSRRQQRRLTLELAPPALSAAALETLVQTLRARLTAANGSGDDAWQVHLLPGPAGEPVLRLEGPGPAEAGAYAERRQQLLLLTQAALEDASDSISRG